MFFKIRKILCRIGIHYRPIYHYSNGKKIRWYEFWKNIDESDIAIRCRICGKL